MTFPFLLLLNRGSAPQSTAFCSLCLIFIHQILVEGLLCDWHCSRHWDTVGNKRKITVEELSFYYCTAELKTFAKGIQSHGSLHVPRNMANASADVEPPKLWGVFTFGQKRDDVGWHMTWHQIALDQTVKSYSMASNSKISDWH